MNEKDIELFRPLAERYARIALDPRMRALEKRCMAHNSLEIVRPLVNVFEVPWGELEADAGLKLCREAPRAQLRGDCGAHCISTRTLWPA